VLRVRDLRVRYPGATADALAGVTFDVAAGELVGVLGATGAGTSTLCRCLDGIVPQLVPAAVEGRVEVDGIDVLAKPVRELAAVVGIVLDEPDALWSQATAGEEVALGLESLAVPYDEMVERVGAALERVGLGGLEGRDPRSLSGGEQQRLAIAAATVLRPRVLVLDGATAGLDPAGRRMVLDLLRELAGPDGAAVLLVDHDTELLAEHADRLLVLDAGRLIADGPPAEVLGRVDELAAAGVRVPDVAAVAAAVLGAEAAPALPVTLDEAVARLGGRA
jgi:energy-coupling factor transporter ATP-binding protein EcfA2